MGCKLNITQLIEAVNGKAISLKAKEFNGVGTDTRNDMTGQLFVPLKGDTFDGHQFLDKAIEQNASIILVHDTSVVTDEMKSKVSIVAVEDTLVALQKLGNYWRKKLKAKVVGITGSNGKTTTKDFAETIIKPYKKVVKSPASFNNHWGVPISLLRVSLEDEVALIEMGMNHSGEITTLCEIAQPDIVVVTMVGSSHIGHFKSHAEVAKAKKEIYEASPKALKIFNGDNEHTVNMYDEYSKVSANSMGIRMFSTYNAKAEVSLRAQSMSLDAIDVSGKIAGVESEAHVHVFGRHNVVNLMAAAAISLAVGVEAEQIWQSMVHCKTSWGRNQRLKLEKGTEVLFDGYNANPESMAAMIKNIYEISAPGKKVVILGEMLEMGQLASAAHSKLGEDVGNTDVDLVWFVGPHNADFEAGIKKSMFQKQCFTSVQFEETIAKQINAETVANDIVVIKGSRGMHLEKVLQLWQPGLL